MAKTAKKPAKTKPQPKKAAAKTPPKAAAKAAKSAKAAGKGQDSTAAALQAAMQRASQIAAELQEEREARQAAEEELNRARAAADPTRLQKLEEQLANATQALSKRESELAVVKAEPSYWLRCPKCGGTLTEIQYEVVKVDRCESCNGIFFDAGEVEQLLATANASPNADHAKAAGWFRGLFKKKGEGTPTA